MLLKIKISFFKIKKNNLKILHEKRIILYNFISKYLYKN